MLLTLDDNGGLSEVVGARPAGRHHRSVLEALACDVPVLATDVGVAAACWARAGNANTPVPARKATVASLSIERKAGVGRTAGKIYRPLAISA